MTTVIDLGALGSRGFKLQGDAAGDWAGRSVSSAGDVNGDGFDDLLVGAPSGNSFTYNAGQAYLIFGKASGLGSIDLALLAAADGFLIRGEAAADFAGHSVSSAGDVNGDGFGDIVIGSRYGNGGAEITSGAAYVVFGKSGGFETVDLSALDAGEGIYIRGIGDGDNAGRSVSSAGDVNGDGVDDLIVGAPNGDQGGANAGEAYVIFGRTAGLGDIDLASLALDEGFIIAGDAEGDSAGISVSAAGDVNRDGYDDILVGASNGNIGGSDSGQAYLLFGKEEGFGAVDLGSLAPEDGFVIKGAGDNDNAGFAVSSAGDFNGDGYDDFVIGAPFADTGQNYNGDVYIVFGKQSGLGTIDLATLAAADGFRLRGGVLDFAGHSVGAAGDVNGDGFDDVVVGAPLGTGGYGAAYVVFGKASGFADIDLPTIAEADGFIVKGDNADDQPGIAVASAGDLDGDGFDELVVGAHFNDSGGTDAGAAYVLWGLVPTTAVTRIGAAADQAIRGGALNDILSGLGGADRLFGAAGNDVLDGGSGADRLAGGLGNDVYRVDTLGDVIVEAAGQGNDTVAAAFSYTLATGASVEALSTSNASSTAALNLTGNEINNSVYGNAGANVLDGGGGNDSLNGLAGDDTLIGGDGKDNLRGGAGNDVYNVDSLDLIFENAGEGSDRIVASSSYALAAGVSVESLGTTNAASTTALDLTGNALANSIFGNAGVNLLVGGEGNDSLSGLAGDDMLDGSTGVDVARGGAGNDVYRVDDAADAIVEAVGEGNDKVSTTTSYTLAAGISVETLGTLNAFATAAIDLGGNERNNSIFGNAGANVISGGGGSDNLNGIEGNDTLKGGIGNDVLRGGGGQDGFQFDAALGSANIDRVMDFAVADDTVLLENAVFTGLAAGALAPGAFRTGAAAADSDDRIVYNSATGALLFDVDGVGGAAAVHFATLSTGLALTASDFTVI